MSGYELGSSSPSGTGPDYRFWAVDPDGGNRRELLAGLVDDHSDPAWSPDGTRLAFYRNFRLVVAEADGTEERELVRRQPGRKVSWSPDGTRLAYVVPDEFGGGEGLWIINDDGTDPRRLLYREHGLGSWAWSPRGDEIAFNDAADSSPQADVVLFAVSVDDATVRQITQPPSPDNGTTGDGWPAWSPDGKRIVFVSNRHSPGLPSFLCYCERQDLYVANADGTGEVTRLPGPGNEDRVEWSPDGRSLVYMWRAVEAPGEPMNTDFRVHVRDLGTGAVREVSPASTRMFGMSWSATPGSRPSADLGASLSADRTSVLPGTPVTLTATVRNAGPAVAESAALEVRPAPGTSFDPAGSPGCAAAIGGSLMCPVGDLPPGGQVSVTVVTSTGEAGIGDASALAVSATSDPDTADNRAVRPIAVCTRLGTSGPDRLRGTSGRDVLCGTGGDDRLLGRGGDDVLLGGPGRDQLLGGKGKDTASYAQARSRVTVDLGVGQADGDGADTLKRVENVVGSSHADRIRGSRGRNVLSGGPGNDVLAPGRGRDQVVGGPGRDRLDYRGSDHAVRLDLDKRSGTGEGADLWFSVEGAIGSRFADHILGSLSSDWIVGGGGDDRVEGLGASDRVAGGPGDDVLMGGDGNDRMLGGSGVDRCAQDYGRGPRSGCEKR
jgi:Tol biopolymer transport system component